MAQVSEQHHHTSQLGQAAVAPPGGVNGHPPPVPALHHLSDEHIVESQVGSSAIAPPVGETVHPAPIPAQYHLDDEEDKSNQSPIKPFQNPANASDTSSSRSRPTLPNDRHTSESQLGPAAVAAPYDKAALPAPAPELHHIKDDHTHDTQLGQPAVAPPSEFVANHLRDETELNFPDLPLFPDNILTAPLLRISLKKLLDQDPSEIDQVWKASRELGFFYLDLRDAVSTSASPSINGPSLLQDVNALFTLGEQLFALPVSEKQKYDFMDQGSYYGYKGLGAGVVDKEGTRDRNEFYNISKDDMLGISAPLPAPELLQQQTARGLLAGYMEKSHAIVTLLLGILNTKLGLPEGKLQSLHKLQSSSGDQVRWVNSPPQPEDDRKKSLGEHTGKLYHIPSLYPCHHPHETNTPRLRHPNPPLQSPRRPPDPAPSKPDLVLRPPPTLTPHREPRRRAGTFQRFDSAEQHPQSGEPARRASWEQSYESCVFLAAGGLCFAEAVDGE